MNQDEQRTFLVSTRILESNEPIVYALREDPTIDSDTGWRFFAEGDEPLETPLKSVKVSELVSEFSSIADILTLPVGSSLKLTTNHEGALTWWDNDLDEFVK